MHTSGRTGINGINNNYSQIFILLCAYLLIQRYQIDVYWAHIIKSLASRVIHLVVFMPS